MTQLNLKDKSIVVLIDNYDKSIKRLEELRIDKAEHELSATETQGKKLAILINASLEYAVHYRSQFKGVIEDSQPTEKFKDIIDVCKLEDLNDDFKKSIESLIESKYYSGIKGKLISESLRFKLSTDDITRDEKITKHILNLNNQVWKEDSVRNITIKRDGSMTFLPKGRISVVRNDSNKWDNAGRQTGKYGKIIRTILQQGSIEFTDKDIEDYVNRIKAAYHSGDFSIVSGEAIREMYDENNYASSCGTLNESCMRYEKCLEYLDIYVKNPDVCKLIALVKGSKVRGRALLWTDNKGRQLMDRVYASDSDRILFRDYAQKNNFYVRENDSANYHGFLDKDKKYIGDVKVYLETRFDYYPYIDTLRWGGDGFITNKEDDSIYTYESTDGSRGSRGYWCEYNDRYYPEDEVTYITHPLSRRRYTYVHKGDAVYTYDNYDCIESETVRVGDEYAHENDPDIIQIGTEWYFMEDCYYIEDADEWVHIDMLDEWMSENDYKYNEDNEIVKIKL